MQPVAGDGRHQAAEIRMKWESAELRQPNEAAKAGSDLAAPIKKSEWLLTHKTGWVGDISCSEHELPLARGDRLAATRATPRPGDADLRRDRVYGEAPWRGST
jgi:hypothetical protein